MRKIIFIVVLVVLVAGSFFLIWHVRRGVVAPTVTIVAHENGFEPATITIKKGDSVTFKNESGTDIWPASNVHPTHELYSAFDPKRPVLNGDSWTFTFDKAGTWVYHDHLYPSHLGTIIVQ